MFASDLFPDAELQSQYLAGLLDSSNAPVYGCDAAGTPVLANQALRDLFGLPSPWLASHMYDLDRQLRDHDDVPLTREQLPSMRALRGERVRDQHLYVRRPDQPRRAFIANAAAIRVEGEVRGAVVALHEVTDQQRHERYQACELEVSRALAAASSARDAAGQVLRTLMTCLGWQYGELWLLDQLTATLHRSTWQAAAGEPPAAVRELGHDLARQAQQRVEPIWWPVASDPPELAGAPLRCAVALPIRSAGQVLGVLSLFATTGGHDREAMLRLVAGIAAQLGQYLERRRAEELALELARTKDDFIALVGHELRTPLTSIVSYTDLLLGDTDAGDPRRQLVQVIRRNAVILSDIVNDLLDLAGLESGHITIRPVTVDLCQLLSDSCQRFRPLADRNNVTLEQTAPPQLVVRADPTRIEQLLNNLMSNAIKYSPDGGTVRIGLRSAGAAAELVVTDSGIGIPAEEREHLFTRFFRASSAKERGIQGTGLGLVITRAIVERHGGTVSCRHGSPGTTMEVRLPIEAPVALPT